MKTKKLRSHIITCAITAILSATCAFVAFYQNSWGKWRKNSGKLRMSALLYPNMRPKLCWLKLISHISS